MPSERLRRLAEIVHEPKALRQRVDPPVLGISCPVVPEELPHAMGLNPRRLILDQEPPTRTSPVVQTFTCTWMQALLDQGMGGDMAHLWGLTLPCNTCDSMQNLREIWSHVGARPAGDRIHNLRLPVLQEGAAAEEMLLHELRHWQQWLEEQTGHALDPSRLSESARLFNELRAALRRLRQAYQAGRVSLEHYHAACAAAQTLDRADVLADLQAALTEVEASPARPAGVRLMLIGGLLDQLDLVRWFDDHDVRVVADDTCSWERTFEPEVDLDPDDPLRDMARRYLRRTPCPVRWRSAAPRLERARRLIRERQAQGVILLPYKGCEPHAFDNVILSQAMEEDKIPLVALEVDPHMGSRGMLENRLEAFVEMIELGEDFDG